MYAPDNHSLRNTVDGTYIENISELVNVVDSLSVELEFEFVDDLFESVSPVGHLCEKLK